LTTTAEEIIHQSRLPIKVWEGTYNVINVNKAVTIIGNGTTNTTITSATQYRVRFTANGATVAGFRITRTTASNTASAVYFNNIQNTHVYNVNVTWANKGFELVDSKNNIIEQSWVNQSSQGVYMSASHGNEIRNITFTNNNLNVDIYDSNSNIFDNNTFKTYGIGIRTTSSHSNTISDNFFYTNTTRWATNLQNSNQTTIVGNEFINSGILIVNNPLHFWFAHTIVDNTVNGVQDR
jgi:parallel beta-helix repeat protein